MMEEPLIQPVSRFSDPWSTVVRGSAPEWRLVAASERPPVRTLCGDSRRDHAREHGLDARTSVGVLARAVLIGDQRLTFVEGTLRRSVGAAALEVRGYAGTRRLARRHAPWSRHDYSFALAALAIAAAATAARLGGLDGFEAYPLLHADAGAADLTLAAALPVLALTPFASAAWNRRSLRRGFAHV